MKSITERYLEERTSTAVDKVKAVIDGAPITDLDFDVIEHFNTDAIRRVVAYAKQQGKVDILRAILKRCEINTTDEVLDAFEESIVNESLIVESKAGEIARAIKIGHFKPDSDEIKNLKPDSIENVLNKLENDEQKKTFKDAVSKYGSKKAKAKLEELSKNEESSEEKSEESSEEGGDDLQPTIDKIVKACKENKSGDIVSDDLKKFESDEDKQKLVDAIKKEGDEVVEAFKTVVKDNPGFEDFEKLLGDKEESKESDNASKVIQAYKDGKEPEEETIKALTADDVKAVLGSADVKDEQKEAFKKLVSEKGTEEAKKALEETPKEGEESKDSDNIVLVANAELTNFIKNVAVAAGIAKVTGEGDKKQIELNTDPSDKDLDKITKDLMQKTLDSMNKAKETNPKYKDLQKTVPESLDKVSAYCKKPKKKGDDIALYSPIQKDDTNDRYKKVVEAIARAFYPEDYKKATDDDKSNNVDEILPLVLHAIGDKLGVFDIGTNKYTKQGQELYDAVTKDDKKTSEVMKAFINAEWESTLSENLDLNAAKFKKLRNTKAFADALFALQNASDVSTDGVEGKPNDAVMAYSLYKAGTATKIIKPTAADGDTARDIESYTNLYAKLGEAVVFDSAQFLDVAVKASDKLKDKAKIEETMKGIFGKAETEGEGIKSVGSIDERMQLDAARGMFASVLSEKELAKAAGAGYKSAKDIKTLDDAKKLAKLFPKSYKVCHDKINAAFENGVAKQQKEEMETTEPKEFTHPITGKKEKRKGRMLGGMKKLTSSGAFKAVDKFMHNGKVQMDLMTCGIFAALAICKSLAKNSKGKGSVSGIKDFFNKVGGKIKDLAKSAAKAANVMAIKDRVTAMAKNEKQLLMYGMDQYRADMAALAKAYSKTYEILSNMEKEKKKGEEEGESEKEKAKEEVDKNAEETKKKNAEKSKTEGGEGGDDSSSGTETTDASSSSTSAHAESTKMYITDPLMFDSFFDYLKASRLNEAEEADAPSDEEVDKNAEAAKEEIDNEGMDEEVDKDVEETKEKLKSILVAGYQATLNYMAKMKLVLASSEQMKAQYGINFTLETTTVENKEAKPEEKQEDKSTQQKPEAEQKTETPAEGTQKPEKAEGGSSNGEAK